MQRLSDCPRCCTWTNNWRSDFLMDRLSDWLLGQFWPLCASLLQHQRERTQSGSNQAHMQIWLLRGFHQSATWVLACQGVACVIETESMATVYLRPHSHHLCVAVTYTRERSTQRLLCQCAQHQHEERSVWRARQRHVSHGRVGWVWVGRADGAGAPCRR